MGVHQFLLLESSVKATLLASELKGLRADRVKQVINAKEIELDGEVVRFSHFRREGKPWIFWPRDGYERDHTRYMQNVAAYRKEHPPVIPTLDFGENNPIKGEMTAFGKEVKDVTNDVLKEYGK